MITAWWTICSCTLHCTVLLHGTDSCKFSGGGGSSGSATLDRLMDKIPFGPKPKIVDLTSDGKLADKVLHHSCLLRSWPSQCRTAGRFRVVPCLHSH